MDTDVAAVSAHARQLFEAQKGAAGLAAARQHFDETLLDWVDVLAAEDEGLTVQGPQLPGAAEASTAAVSSSSFSSSESAPTMSRSARAHAVSALWIEWAALEKELKQWKQAVKTYDQVLHKCVCMTRLNIPLLHILPYSALFYTSFIPLHIFNLWPMPEVCRLLPVLVVTCDRQALINKIIKPSFKTPLTRLKAQSFACII